MAAKRIIVVVGATGVQGGSVANTFLHLSNWHVRAITRNPSSEAAQVLRAKGAEIVSADLANPASLTTAFANANAIFLNTTFWEVYGAAKAALEAENKDIAAASQKAFNQETTWGKNVAMAAAAVPSLERFIFSSLPSVSEGHKYTRSLHPEAKNWIVEYIEHEQPALAKKMSVIYLGAYCNNPLLQPMLDKESGVYKFISPLHEDTYLSVIDPYKSTGLFVRELIENEPPGIKLLAYDSDLTMAQHVKAWSEASGKEAVLVSLTPEILHQMGAATWELLDGIGFANKHKGVYEAIIPDIVRPEKLKTKVGNKWFEEWLKERDWDEVLASKQA